MRISVAILTIGALASPAFAADLPNRAAPPVFDPPMVAATWTGCYAGGAGAVDIARSDNQPSDLRSNEFTTTSSRVTPVILRNGPVIFQRALRRVQTTTVTDESARNTAPYGGTHVGGDGTARIGCNYQAGRLVFGGQLEAGYLGGSNGLTNDPRRPTTASFVDGGFYTAVSGRLGYAVFDRTLVFVRGGIGYADLKYATFDPVFGFANNVRGSQAMPLAGAGIEYKLTPQIGVTAEYTYMRPGCRTIAYDATTGIGGGSSRTCLDKHTVSLGLNYYFATPTPVVARY